MAMTKDNHLPAECLECKNKWEQALLLPMEMRAFAASVKKIRCPKCGSKEIIVNFGAK
jgi:hypothetical protein